MCQSIRKTLLAGKLFVIPFHTFRFASPVNVSNENCRENFTSISGNVSNKTCQINVTYCFIYKTDPVVLSGLIIIFIGLFLGLVIIFIRKLHSTSMKNSFFIVITMIIMIVGLGLFVSCAKWYELLISLPAATAFNTLAILMGIKLKDLEKKFKTILLIIFFVLIGIGLILLFIGQIFLDVSRSHHDFPESTSE
ncbi:unnamed protein product [Schistosoma margrebowiei]|uniref:Uncharacterized protein n=1 Tax=Schistosoma margrebowiei TaxID=48269 RepID=A0AA85APL7_9TREM|nr:unnamed protein product [Schistosoma margrebowiei]